MKIRHLRYLLAYLIPFSAFLAMELQIYWSFNVLILALVFICFVKVADHVQRSIVVYTLAWFIDHLPNAKKCNYQVQRHMEDSLQLSDGYPASILMASVPPVWFRILNPKVKANNN